MTDVDISAQISPSKILPCQDKKKSCPSKEKTNIINNEPKTASLEYEKENNTHINTFIMAYHNIQIYGGVCESVGQHITSFI